MSHRFADPAVDQAFRDMAVPISDCLLKVRDLILEIAEDLPETGGLQETLKWGQPSYLPRRPRVGTTVRLGAAPANTGKAALFVHCQTRLIETCRHVHPELDYAGNRAILLEPGDALPRDALDHFIRLALTYHIRKRKRA